MLPKATCAEQHAQHQSVAWFVCLCVCVFVCVVVSVCVCVVWDGDVRWMAMPEMWKLVWAKAD